MMRLNTDRARTLLRQEGLDGLISSTLVNNYYLSGVWFMGQDMFPHDGESYVVTSADRPEAGTVVSSIGGADETLSAYDTIADVVTFGTFFREIVPDVDLDPAERRVRELTEAHQTGRGAVDALVAAMTAQGLTGGAVAVDERGPNRDLLAQLGERCPDTRFEPAAGLLRRIRAVKTPEEQANLTATLRVTETAFRATVDAFAEGITERELKSVWEQSVVSQGAHPGFCLLRFGRGLALGQVPAGDAVLHKGQFAFFDMGCDLDGYKSDIGRVVCFGEPDDQLQSMFDASRAGQQAAIDMMAPGTAASDVFDRAVEVVRQSGIPSYQRQHVGHGIGIEYYDLPVLTPTADTVLEAGMVFEVETPHYRLGVGGAFIEDTVLVTDSGAEVLTTLDRELIIIDPA